jgi:hypothetical protein
VISGAAGCRKSGPTAQLVTIIAAAKAVVFASHLAAIRDMGQSDY